MRRLFCLTLLLASSLTPTVRAQQSNVRTSFRIKSVAERTVELDAGSDAGLQPGQRLEVKRRTVKNMASGDGVATANRLIARLTVSSVTRTSAACQVTWIADRLHSGDLAALTAEDARKLIERQETAQNHPTMDSRPTIAVARGDSPDTDVRSPSPRPQPVEVNPTPEPAPQPPAETKTAAQVQQSASQPTVQQASPSVQAQQTEVRQSVPPTPPPEMVAVVQAAETDVRTSFPIKYVAEGAVYLSAGRNAGLEEGQHLQVKRTEAKDVSSSDGTATASRLIARLTVSSVAATSAVCEVTWIEGELRAGDIAALTAEDARALLERQAAVNSRKYLQVITFTEGDPLDEEVRESVPRPPLPEINRARGRIGFEYSGVAGPVSSSHQVGVVLRLDMTRIGGTYWNFSGYTRIRQLSRSSGPQSETIRDLLNRTYHLQLSYMNPNSRWVAGFGRLYVPWATSLNTIDGGYFGRRVGRTATVGLFAGSTPDPTSWNYNPDRRIAGAFASFEGGNFDNFRFTSTMGFGLSSIRWRVERPFAFFENSFFYKHTVAVYHTLEADKPRVEGMNGRSTAGVSRSYLTFRVQPHPRVSLDLSHNYFRDFPTFDPRLVSTGLVDKLLFQGFSGGVRVDLPYRVGVYGNFGRSKSNSDARGAWNQLYGLTLGDLPWVHLRADLRYSKFDSAFGRGTYRAISVSKDFRETIRLETQAGFQHFTSPLTRQSNSRYISTTLDWFLGMHYFLGAGFTWNRGALQDYNQAFLSLGYRF